MAPDRVRELLRAAPFRPFTVHTADGKALTIRHPDFASLSPAGMTLVVYEMEGEGDRMHVLDLILVTRLERETGVAAAPGEGAPGNGGG